jgi:putative tricarboxylic transport membrane protein
VDFLTHLGMGFGIAFTPFNVMMAVAGVLVGILIGALPGVGPPSGVAMLLPLTFGMDPTSGIIMLAALYAGTMYGGTITAVLINTPGESASVVTCLDGYQMARQGRAGHALGIAAIGSFIAGTVGVVLLMLVAPLLARWALSFGPPETFALMLLGLTTVTLLTGEDPIKGYISMMLGLVLAMVGFDIISGDARYGFGIPEMMDGIDFLPVAIGLFGLGEVLAGAEQSGRLEMVKSKLGVRDALPRWVDFVRCRWAIVRGTVMGFSVGVLPGAGPTVASFLAYTVEKKVSKHPGQFGKGAIEGVAAPESSNNAAATAAMVPMLTLGIPGSATTAIMLGGLMMWGLRPGPLLFEKNPQFVWGLIASQYIANVLLLILSTAFIPLFVRALRIPYSILMPLIVIFCVTGAYSLKNNVWDVGVMLVFGVIGYFMKRLGYSPAALVLALVLGPLAERALRQSLIISDAGLGIFFTRPISAVLTSLALAAIAVPLLKALARFAARRNPNRGQSPNS